MSEKDIFNDHTDVIRSFNKHKRKILVFTLLSLLVSLIFTAFKAKTFVSSVTFFPSKINAPDIAYNVPRMGYNIEADRLIQIAQSNSLKDSLCSKFNLADRFNLDTNQLAWRNNLHSRLSSMMHFERTKYMSIVLSITSNDPELSSDLANYTVELLARFWERLYKENSQKTLRFNQQAVSDKNKEILYLLDSISIIRKSNKNEKAIAIKELLVKKQIQIDKYVSDIEKVKASNEFYNSEFQLEKLTEKQIENNALIEIEKAKLATLDEQNDQERNKYKLTKARIEGAQKNLNFINDGIKSLKVNGSRYELLMMELKMVLNQYSALESQYEAILTSDELKVSSVELEELEATLYYQRQQYNLIKGKFEDNFNYYYMPLPNIFISEFAVPNYKNSAPSYFKNALLAAILGFFTSSVFFLIFFNHKKELI